MKILAMMIAASISAATAADAQPPDFWKGNSAYVAGEGGKCILTMIYGAASEKTSHIFVGYRSSDQKALLTFQTSAAESIKDGEKRPIRFQFDGTDKIILNMSASGKVETTGDGVKRVTAELFAEPFLEALGKAQGFHAMSQDDWALGSWTLSESAEGIRQLKKCTLETAPKG